MIYNDNDVKWEDVLYFGVLILVYTQKLVNWINPRALSSVDIQQLDDVRPLTW